jgi:hypothetical protein
MIVDVKKIVADTLQVFSKSSVQRKKFSEIQSWVSDQDYQELHKSFLTPLSIKIDCEQFKKEIQKYKDHFEQWGTQHTHLPRYGLALVNQDGILKKKDPINGSLYEWNMKYPDNPIIETDCLTPTEVMNLECMKPLRVFDGHWARSNIFKWHSYADFKPHIDTVIPSPWIRLWATTDSENLDIRFANKFGELIKVDNIEAGRIYIIDTSIVHDAASRGDDVYQFFLSVLPSSINILKELTCRH